MLVNKIYSALGNKKKAEAQKIQEQEQLRAKIKEQENQIQIFTNHNQINMFIVEVIRLMNDGRYRSAISKIYCFFNSDQCIQISSVQTLKLIRRYFGCLSYIMKKVKSSEIKPSEQKLKTLFLLLKRANELLSEQNRIILTLILKGQDVSRDRNPNINRLSIQMESSLIGFVKMSQRSEFKGLISYDSELKSEKFDFKKHVQEKSNSKAQKQAQKEEKKFDLDKLDKEEDDDEDDDNDNSTDRLFTYQTKKQLEQEEKRKKLIQKKKVLFHTKQMIVCSLKLCQFWAFYFKQKNMISQYALSLKKGLEICKQVQDCWEDDYQKEMINIKIEVSNFYFEQQNFEMCQKMMNKVWDNIVQQFNIKHLIITVLGNITLLEEYQGNYSRLIECFKLQVWLAQNYLEGVHDEIVITCSNNYKNALKKYGEVLNEEGEILKVLNDVFGIKEEFRNKLKFNTCEDQFQEELNNKLYKKYKFEKLNKALVIMHKRSKSATKEDLLKAYRLQPPKNKLLSLLEINQEELENDTEFQQQQVKSQKQVIIQLPEVQLTKINSHNTTLSTRLSDSLASPALMNISQSNDFLKESFLSPLHTFQQSNLADSQEKKLMIDILDNIKEEEDFILSRQQIETNQMQNASSIKNLDKISENSKISDKPSYLIKKKQQSLVKRPPKQIQKPQFQYGLSQPVVLTTNKYWEPQKLYSETPVVVKEIQKKQESMRRIQSENNLDEKEFEITKKQKTQPIEIINLDKYFKEYIENDLNTKQSNFSIDFIREGVGCIMEDERFDNKEFFGAKKFIEFKLKFRQAVKDGEEELNFNRGKIGLRELVHREFLDLKNQEIIHQDIQKNKSRIQEMQERIMRQKQKEKQSFAQRFMNHRQLLNLNNVYDTKQENERQFRIKEKREQKLANLLNQKISPQRFNNLKSMQEPNQQNSDQKPIQYYKEFAKKGINLFAESTFNSIQKNNQEMKKIMRKQSCSMQIQDTIINTQDKANRLDKSPQSKQQSPKNQQLSSIVLRAMKNNSEISFLNINNPSYFHNQNSSLWSDCFYNKTYYNQLATSCNMFGTKQAAKKAKSLGEIASLALKVTKQNGSDVTKRLFSGQEQKKIRKKTVHKNILELMKQDNLIQTKKILDCFK